MAAIVISDSDSDSEFEFERDVQEATRRTVAPSPVRYAVQMVKTRFQPPLGFRREPRNKTK